MAITESRIVVIDVPLQDFIDFLGSADRLICLSSQSLCVCTLLECDFGKSFRIRICNLDVHFGNWWEDADASLSQIWDWHPGDDQNLKEHSRTLGKLLCEWSEIAFESHESTYHALRQHVRARSEEKKVFRSSYPYQVRAYESCISWTCFSFALCRHSSILRMLCTVTFSYFFDFVW